ncbi:MAG: Flp pilus assembly complex ATPase component TadA [Planctomycetes bacterium]|nr:Flp pilus assembly complex ATPase component TadA [Planctomycetota bacterium]
MRHEKEQRAFWTRLSRLLARGVPLGEAMEGIIAEVPPGEWRMSLEGVRDALTEGKSLASALSAQVDIFDEPLVTLIRAAEQQGRLAAGLQAAPWLVGVSDESAIRRLLEGGAMGPLEAVFGAAAVHAHAAGGLGKLDPIPASGNLVETVLQEASGGRVSDVHIEPTGKDVRVRYRIDGVLQTRHVLSNGSGRELVQQLRKLAGINGDSPRAADGRAKVELDGRTVMARVSVVPVQHGDRLVLRLLGPESRPRRLAELGLGEEAQRRLRAWTERPSGLVLVTGPTGSGKTTTIYALLATATHDGRSVLTVEDPVEMVLDGVSQVPVDLKLGLSFVNAIKQAFRQDPDVLMVGEVRDQEGAQLTVQGALTGHLIITALHAPTATGALRRMADVGIAPWILRDTVVGVVCQRLVRTTCPKCRVEHNPSRAVREEVLHLTGRKAEGLTAGRGCEECAGTGYRGRTGIYEVLEPTLPVWKHIDVGAPDAEVHAAAAREGLVPLRAAGLERALAGVTTPEEVLRVTA